MFLVSKTLDYSTFALQVMVRSNTCKNDGVSLTFSFSNNLCVYMPNVKSSDAAATVFMHIRWHAAILVIIMA